MSISRFDQLAASPIAQITEVIGLWGPRALDLSNPGMSLGGLLTPTPVTYDGIDAATVARATLENIAFAIRECVALVDEVAPGPAGPIALTGGMAASEAFAGMLANTMGRPVRRHPPRASASGAAIVAGLPRDAWAKAGTEAATHAEVVEPDPSAALAAAERYERWLRLRAKLDALADDL
jgi:sugar (pentulose or hexulose) kinase